MTEADLIERAERGEVVGTGTAQMAALVAELKLYRAAADRMERALMSIVNGQEYQAIIARKALGYKE